MKPEQIKAVEALAEKLGDAALAQGDHVFALNALLTAYMSIAKTNSCCHQGCSEVLFKASLYMAQLGVQSAQPGQKVH